MLEILLKNVVIIISRQFVTIIDCIFLLTLKALNCHDKRFNPLSAKHVLKCLMLGDGGDRGCKVAASPSTIPSH